MSAVFYMGVNQKMKNKNILVEVKDLQKYYPVPKRKLLEKQRYLKAVERLNLCIPEGCTYGLVGESGCGKSTTGQMLADIFSSTGGSILYRGENLSEMDRTKKRCVRRKIQMIFQDPYSSLNPKKKIGWILEEPLKIHTDLKKQERQEQVRKILETVGLDESYRDRYPNELSGGQRQRVSIAAALILDPEFIIADEAVSALDVSVQAQILNLLKMLQKERNLTYLFISHDLNVVQYMSDYIGVMYMGYLVESGTAEEIWNHPAHPYTKALLSAVPEIWNENQKRIVLEGEVPSPIDTPAGCPFHTRCPYATEKCAKEQPVSENIGGEHQVSCHYLQEE